MYDKYYNLTITNLYINNSHIINISEHRTQDNSIHRHGTLEQVNPDTIGIINTYKSLSVVTAYFFFSVYVCAISVDYFVQLWSRANDYLAEMWGAVT